MSNWRNNSPPSNYQSHQSGIETEDRSGRTNADQNYQSHQSGIETWKDDFDAMASKTTNRTNLELKHEPGRQKSDSPCLPIAPIWNWNLEQEAKNTLPVNYQSHQSGIETEHRTEVRLAANATNRTNLELKHTSVLKSRSHFITTNRTNLELKRPTTPPTFTGTPLPIAPIWNWNNKPDPRSRASRYYQSHQSGIETSSEYGTLSRTVGYQSHQSGIETTKHWKKKSEAWGYQSHQSGIETRLREVFYQTL